MMNGKRKTLTVIGLVVFGVIMWQHHANDEHIRLTSLLALGVFYAGLYALLGGESKPRNWRRIMRVTSLIVAGLVVIGALIGATIYTQQREATRQWHIESEKREQTGKIEEEKREQAKQAQNLAKEKREQAEKQAEQLVIEASRHRIKPSEIDVIDLRVQYSEASLEIEEPHSFGIFDDLIPSKSTHYRLTGRIRNRSNHTLNSITLMVRLYEKEGLPDILGEETLQINVGVPPHQTRAIGSPISLDDSPQLAQYALKYAITEIRGSTKKD
jgi:hypothetical protein